MRGLRRRHRVRAASTVAGVDFPRRRRRLAARSSFLTLARGFRMLLFVILTLRVFDQRALRLGADLLVGGSVHMTMSGNDGPAGTCPSSGGGFDLARGGVRTSAGGRPADTADVIAVIVGLCVVLGATGPGGCRSHAR